MCFGLDPVEAPFFDKKRRADRRLLACAHALEFPTARGPWVEEDVFVDVEVEAFERRLGFFPCDVGGSAGEAWVGACVVGGACVRVHGGPGAAIAVRVGKRDDRGRMELAR